MLPITAAQQEIDTQPALHACSIVRTIPTVRIVHTVVTQNNVPFERFLGQEGLFVGVVGPGPIFPLPNIWC